MARPKRGELAANEMIIQILKVHRNQFFTIDDLMAMADITREGVFAALRTITDKNRYWLRIKRDNSERKLIIGVALFLDREENLYSQVYNPACWPIPKSLRKPSISRPLIKE